MNLEMASKVERKYIIVEIQILQQDHCTKGCIDQFETRLFLIGNYFWTHEGLIRFFSSRRPESSCSEERKKLISYHNLANFR